MAQAGAHGMQTESVERNSFVLYYRTYTLAVTTSAGETFLSPDDHRLHGDRSLSGHHPACLLVLIEAMLLVLIVGGF